MSHSLSWIGLGLLPILQRATRNPDVLGSLLGSCHAVHLYTVCVLSTAGTVETSLHTNTSHHLISVSSVILANYHEACKQICPQQDKVNIFFFPCPLVCQLQDGKERLCLWQIKNV